MVGCGSSRVGAAFFVYILLSLPTVLVLPASTSPASPADPTDGLRDRLIGTDPVAAGITPTERLPRVWGGLMELRLGPAVASVIALADGTISLSVSLGGGIVGGVTGGVAQAYATMGFCTCMKTVEITQHKIAASGVKPPSTFATFLDIYRREGIRGINKGVNAVAIRQMTNWGSRFGLSRLAEQGIRRATGKEHGEKLNAAEKILASTLGGGLSAWNQPIEVIRVEMQSKKVDPNRPKKMTVGNTARYIYETNGLKGLYRGVAPRIGLGVWQTVCMVALGDM